MPSPHGTAATTRPDILLGGPVSTVGGPVPAGAPTASTALMPLGSRTRYESSAANGWGGPGTRHDGPYPDPPRHRFPVIGTVTCPNARMSGSPNRLPVPLPGQQYVGPTYRKRMRSSDEP